MYIYPETDTKLHTCRYIVSYHGKKLFCAMTHIEAVEKALKYFERYWLITNQ